MQEKIFHMAGSKTPQEQTVATLENAIREAGRIPAQRNTFYEKIGTQGVLPPGRLDLPTGILASTWEAIEKGAFIW